MKGEKYFEKIHENYVPNVKDHVLSTFVTKYNEVRVVPNTSLHQNSILKKKRKLLKKHNSGLSTLPKRSDNQIKINICMEEENVLEVLFGVDHRKKRTWIKARKINFDEHFHLVKRARICSIILVQEALYEIIVFVMFSRFFLVGWLKCKLFLKFKTLKRICSIKIVNCF